jgi:hypothetical protein
MSYSSHQNPSLPAELIDTLAEAVRGINRFAHRTAEANERRHAYSVKAALISAAIVALGPERLIFSYQKQHHGEVLLSVSIRGTRPRAFHVPPEALSQAAFARVINEIGTPGAFLRWVDGET